MTSPDVYAHVAHRAFDVESAGAGADRHVLARLSGDGALAALVVDRDLAHGGARADLHAGLLVEADADRTHLAAHLARAGVDAAARGHGAGLRHDVDRATEIVDVDAPPGGAEGPGVLLLEGHMLDHHGVAVHAHAVGAFGDGSCNRAVGHDLGAAELGENLDGGGLRRGLRGWG